MPGAPSIHYAHAVGADLAYQVFGDGAVDVVAIPPFAQNIELMWERPEFAAMFERLGSFARVVHFDKRGTGASDRTVAVPTLDERVDDTRAVMDAAGIDRAVIYGVSEGGPMAILFAATYPERVTSLVLHATAARFVPSDEPDEERERRLAGYAHFAAAWGTEKSVTLRQFAPSIARDPSYVAWEQRYERQSATRRDVEELLAMLTDIDVTALLAHLAVPTLVVHRTGDRVAPLEHARLLAEHIPGARLAEFDGDDHFPHVGDTGGWLGAVEEFLTGAPVTRSPALHFTPPRLVTEIRTLGGFSVICDGHHVPAASWGSRRARQLCKRLAAAAGTPVPREQLIDMLWPDAPEPFGKLGARLSVQLSTVRRILGGGVIADRTAIRIDPAQVRIDLVALDDAMRRDDLAAVVSCYKGPFLPEDPYDDWTMIVRARAQASFVTAACQLVAAAHADGRHDRALQHALDWLDVDHYDQHAHHAVIASYLALGRHREAQRSHHSYTRWMAELRVTPVSLDAIASPTRL